MNKILYFDNLIYYKICFNYNSLNIVICLAFIKILENQCCFRTKVLNSPSVQNCYGLHIQKFTSDNGIMPQISHKIVTGIPFINGQKAKGKQIGIISTVIMLVNV